MFEEIPNILLFVELLLTMVVMAASSDYLRLVAVVSHAVVGAAIAILLFGLSCWWLGMLASVVLLIGALLFDDWFIGRYGVQASVPETSEDEHEDSLHR